MSELSESLHFWRTSPAQVAEMVRAAAVPGRIIAANERWTSFVSLEEHEHEQLAESVPALTLHWAFAEDFCLMLTVRDAGKLVAECELGWSPIPEETAPVPMRSNHLEALLEIGILVEPAARLELLASAVVARTAIPEQVRDAAARLLGLPAYEWLSPSYCADLGLSQLRQQYPSSEDVELEPVSADDA